MLISPSKKRKNRRRKLIGNRDLRHCGDKRRRMTRPASSLLSSRRRRRSTETRRGMYQLEINGAYALYAYQWKAPCISRLVCHERKRRSLSAPRLRHVTRVSWPQRVPALVVAVAIYTRVLRARWLFQRRSFGADDGSVRARERERSSPARSVAFYPRRSRHPPAKGSNRNEIIPAAKDTMTVSLRT